MKNIVEFHHMSTGYIEGSTPPKFDPEQAKPIPACGSDAYFFPDNRYSKENIIHQAHERMRKLNQNLGKGYVGFIIYYGNSVNSMAPHYKSRSDLKANY